MNLKYLFSIVCLLLALPFQMIAFEYTYEGVTLEYNNYNESECLVKATGDITGHVVIPSIAIEQLEEDNYKNYTVIGIESSGFRECNLESVDIPNTVKIIYDRAFAECTNLKSVALPESINEIEEQAFAGCKSLTSISLPSSLSNISI